MSVEASIPTVNTEVNMTAFLIVVVMSMSSFAYGPRSEAQINAQERAAAYAALRDDRQDKINISELIFAWNVAVTSNNSVQVRRINRQIDRYITVEFSELHRDIALAQHEVANSAAELRDERRQLARTWGRYRYLQQAQVEDDMRDLRDDTEDLRILRESLVRLEQINRQWAQLSPRFARGQYSGLQRRQMRGLFSRIMAEANNSVRRDELEIAEDRTERREDRLAS